MTRSPVKEARPGTPAPASLVPAMIGTLLRLLGRFLTVAAKVVVREPVRLPARSEAISRSAQSTAGERHAPRPGRNTFTPCATKATQIRPPPGPIQIV